MSFIHGELLSESDDGVTCGCGVCCVTVMSSLQLVSSLLTFTFSVLL